MAPINFHLPKEVLCETFRWLTRMCTVEYTRAYGAAAEDLVYSWLPITYVCRYWRDITLDLAELWTFNSVGDGRNSRRLREFLKRSRYAPLIVKHGRFWPDAHMPYFILDEMHRMRGFQVSLILGNDWKQLYTSLSHAPLLESLEIYIPAPDWIIVEPTRQLPKLRNLTIDGYGSDAMVRSLSSASLTKLAVAFWDPSSVSGWLDTLRGLPLLEELTTELSSGSPSSPRVPLAERIPMPRMRSFRFRSKDPYDRTWAFFSGLLGGLILPADTQLRFQGVTKEDWDSQLFGGVFRAIASLVHDDTLASPQRPISAYIFYRPPGRYQGQSRFTLKTWSEEVPMAQLSLISPEPQQDSLTAPPTDDRSQIAVTWDITSHIEAAFDAFLSQSLLPDLRILHITGVPSQVHSWHRFAHAQNLREISIGPDGPALTLLSALQPERAGEPEGYPGVSTPLFPNLEALTLRSVRWNQHVSGENCTPPLVDDVRKLLASRSRLGISIKRLVVEDGVNVRWKQMEDLELEMQLEEFRWDREGGHVECEFCIRNTLRLELLRIAPNHPDLV